MEQTTNTVEPGAETSNRGGRDRTRETAAVFVVSVKGDALAESASIEELPELIKIRRRGTWSGGLQAAHEP